MKLLIASIVLGMAVMGPAGTSAADAPHAVVSVQMADAAEPGAGAETVDPAADAAGPEQGQSEAAAASGNQNGSPERKEDGQAADAGRSDSGQSEQEQQSSADPQTAEPEEAEAVLPETGEVEKLPDMDTGAPGSEGEYPDADAPEAEQASDAEAAAMTEADPATADALTDADSSGLTEAELLTDAAAEEIMGTKVEGLAAKTLNGWTEINQKKYYYENGVAVTGFSTIDGAVYHFEEDGSLTVGAAEIDGSRYYFDSEGKMQTGLVSIDENQYYFGSDGRMKTGFVNIDQSQYYFDTAGKMLTGWQKINGFRYNMGEDGSIRTGWQTIDGNNYYFYPATDKAKKQYKGTAVKGFFNWKTGQYYFDASNIMTLGWQKINGFRYNMGTDGKIKTGWQTIDGKKYYFYPATDKTKKQYKGTAVKGFFNWDKAQYYFDASNAMTLGWQKINGFRYNMGTDGRIKTGWQTIDGKKYYFYPVTVNARGHYKGTAAIGHTLIDNKLYYFQNDGVQSSKMPTMTLTAIDYKKDDYYGDVALLYSGGKYLLIDTGSEDNGPRYVINYLKKRGVHKLDIYISHYHDDHMANVDSILKDSYFTVGTIYMPDHSYMENQPGEGFSKYDNIYKKFIKTANAKGVKKVYLKKGSTFTIGDCTAKVIYMEGKARLKGEEPTGSKEQIKDKNLKYVNNRSLVTMFTCGEIRYLNCGDIEKEVENKLLAQKIDIRADIFKLNHHAGHSSNSTAFLKAVNAKYAYHTSPNVSGSLGKKDSWIGGPVTNAMSRSNLYSTLFNGNVTFTVNKGQITASPDRNYKTVNVKGVHMISSAVKNFTVKIANGTNYIKTNLSLPVAYKLK